MPVGITQCYLPPGNGDFSALTPAEAGTRFSDPGEMRRWVDLGGWLQFPRQFTRQRRSPVSEINNQAVSWPGGEPSTLESWVRRPNHSTTEWNKKTGRWYNRAPLLTTECMCLINEHTNVCVLYEIVEYISGDNYATGCTINVLAAHAQTLSSLKLL